MKPHLFAVVASVALSSSFFALPVLAQDNSTLATASASQRSNEQTEQTIGIGIDYGNRYFSGKTNWQAGLFGEANFSNGMFLSTKDGVGYRFLNNYSGFSAAASVGVSGWRKEGYGKNDSHNRLLGMGDIDPLAQANLFLNYDMGAFHVNTALHQTMGDRHGASADVTARYDVLATKTDLVELSGGFSYANKEEMNTFFGVSNAQSASSGNTTYSPKAGITGAGLGINWRHVISPNWVSSVGVHATRLGDAASASPLSERGTNTGIGASIGYRF